MKYLMTLVVALSTVSTVKAESLPESLLRCDSRFFSELNIHKAAFKNVVSLSEDKVGHAWFTPKEGNDAVWFTQPVKSGQLTLSGYWSDKSDLGEMGKYYYWGLIFDESPGVVMEKLSNVTWQKAGEEFFANPMIKQSGSHSWQVNNGAASGIAPAKGSVEKLVILDMFNGKSRLLCSVQGNVTAQDLLPLRPDLLGGK